MRRKGVVGIAAFGIAITLVSLGLFIGFTTMKIRIQETMITEYKTDELPLTLNALMSMTKDGTRGQYLAGDAIAIEGGNFKERTASKLWNDTIYRYRLEGYRSCTDIFYLREGNSFQESNYEYFVEGQKRQSDGTVVKCDKFYAVITLFPIPYNSPSDADDSLTKIVVLARD